MNTRTGAIIIAAASSGSGKTSVAIGLAAALHARGLRVQPFKVGPDFLDPTWLSLAARRPCYNLDPWMTSGEYVNGLFATASADADIAVIEGVMGLYDGADPSSIDGSTAEIARLLDLPLLFVVNARGMSRSIAPLVKGFDGFEEGVRIGGVVANHCGSDRHASLLDEALRSSGAPPLVGHIKTGALPVLPARHLGVRAATEDHETTRTIEALGEAIARSIDLDRLIAIGSSRSNPVEFATPEAPPSPPERRSAAATDPEPVAIRIGVAHDEAFYFYYRDNLKLLEEQGAELHFFSPVRDTALPADLDALYLGGGYPEDRANELARNGAMRESIVTFAQKQKPIYAECGGLIYLSRSLETLDGSTHDFVALLPASARMRPRRKLLGYTTATTMHDSLLGPAGTPVRGHEFHYSEIDIDADAAWPSAYRITDRRTGEIRNEGYCDGTVFASYVHVHFASNPSVARSFVDSIRKRKKNYEASTV